MTAIIIPKTFHKLLVVGPLYDKADKLARVEELIPQYDWTILNGGLLYPFNDKAAQRIEKVQQLIAGGKVIYLAGRLDYLQMNNLQDKKLEAWMQNCPNVAIADFSSRSVVVVDGGIPPNTTRQDLMDSLEVSFISQIDNKPWHLNYNGGLGYVISNNPLTVTTPQYYKYSMQLGCQYTTESPVYAQEVDEIGLKKLITL